MRFKKINRGFIYENEDPDVVRVPQYKIEEYRRLAQKINERTMDINETNHLLRFAGKNNYPLVHDLINHKVSYHMREYLPMLIFYLEVDIDDGSQDYKDTMEYIRLLMDLYVDIVDDEDMEAIDSVSRTVWSNMGLEERVELFEPLMIYYGQNEFEGFLLDLGWKRFMAATEGYQKSKYRYGYIPESLYEELEAVWLFENRVLREGSQGPK